MPRLFITLLFFLVFQNIKTQSVTDVDGNTYQSIIIGKQIWMNSNLNVAHFRNGDDIPNIVNDSVWARTEAPAFCNYLNDQKSIPKYGKLYNFYTINDNRGVCPTGWHVPTDKEWTELTDYLGGEKYAAPKLRSYDSTIHSLTYTGGTNETNFSTIFGGNRDKTGKFEFYDCGGGIWWSSTEFFDDNIWYRSVPCDRSYVYKAFIDSKSGLSIRCISNKKP